MSTRKITRFAAHSKPFGGTLQEEIMDIKVTKTGITHYQAMCTICEFTEADHTDPEYVRQLVYKHIRKTGHKVVIEKGVATHYEAAERAQRLTLGTLCRKGDRNVIQSK